MPEGYASPRLTGFIAEGATGGTLAVDAQVGTASPGATDARVLYRFLKTDGTTVSQFIDLPMMTRHTLNPGPIAGLSSAEFSTVVESDVQVVADRTMTWDASGCGSHAETAMESAALIWNLSEGSTNGFDLFYLI